MIQTEWPFTLLKGYVDEEGTLHREGVMRLATAADEIVPHGDPRVRANPAYHTIILMSRVVARLGTLKSVSPRVVENIPAQDLTHLVELYNRINGTGSASVPAVCPDCGRKFEVELNSEGGSAATP